MDMTFSFLSMVPRLSLLEIFVRPSTDENV